MITAEMPETDELLATNSQTLDQQMIRTEKLDAVSGIMLGVTGMLLALILMIILRCPDQTINLLIVRVALIPTVFSLVLSFSCVNIRKFVQAPRLEQLRAYYIAGDVDATKRKIIEIYSAGIPQNEKIIKLRRTLVEWAIAVLTVSMVMLFILLLLVTLERFFA